MDPVRPSVLGETDRGFANVVLGPSHTYRPSCSAVAEGSPVSTETWRGGRLAALTSRTDDNGTPHDISVGTTSLVPASLWNADLLHSGQALNTIDGSTDAIRVQNLGSEAVATGGGQVRADHYAVRGGLDRDLWYAGATLVHVRFTAEDGSQVDYVLR